MPLPANEARGEVAVTVDGVDLVVAAEMEKLAHLSSALGCKTLPDLYQRLAGSELSAMFGVLDTCVVKGDAKAARKAMKLQGAMKLGAAITEALAHHAEGDDSGNAPSAKGKR